MEALLGFQMAQKELLERFITNYKKDGKARKTANYYAKRLRDFQTLWDEAITTHRKILIEKQARPDDAKEKLDEYFKRDIFSSMEDHFFENYSAMEDKFQTEFPSNDSEFSRQEVVAERSVVGLRKGEETIRLPKISLEKFSGDYRKWPQFHDLFRALVHENSSLSAAQKLQYLKLHLVGEAENLLRHFHVTDKNYEPAWEILEERYNNQRVLVNTQLKILLSQNSATNESANSIKGLLDTTTECLQALENLEVSTKEWDPLIVFLIVQKLPAETHSLWEQNQAPERKLASWESLKIFLNARFRTLEAITTRKSPASSKDNRFQSNPRPMKQVFHSVTSANCLACSRQHNIYQCSKFSAMPFSKKFELVKSKGMCLNCLKTGHIRSSCPSPRRCSVCQQDHHTLMHRNSTEPQSHVVEIERTQPQRQTPLIASAPVFVPPSQNNNQVNSFFVKGTSSNPEILLATALIRVIAPSGKERVLRALIDQGSQASFITESAIQDLQLPKQAIRTWVSGVGQNDAGQVRAKVHLVLKPRNDETISIETTGLALKRLTNLLPPRKIHPQTWSHIEELELADPLYYQPGKIDLLLGAEIYAQIIQDGIVKGEPGSPIAQRTVFGWILSGEIIENRACPKSINSFHLLTDLNEQLRQFWELENVNNEKSMTEEERKCEDNFASTFARLHDGRYQVSLPFGNSNADQRLGESKTKAVAQLRQVENKLKGDSNFQAEYQNCIKEYEQLGHMRRIEPDTQLGASNYLPHHAVIKESSSTTKLRVVFNASRKTSSGFSPNDLLLKGPVIQDELASLLLRWRKYRVAFTADIEKMYRQIWIKPDHAKYQRIVWREFLDDPIQDYELLTVTFGTKSAPYLATRVLQQLANDEMDNYPIGAQAALSEFYVDDLLSGSDTVDLALEKQNQIMNLLKRGGFNLRKWASNTKELMENVKDAGRQLKVHLNVDEQIKALGLHWDPHTDALCYSFKLNEPEFSYSKRLVLSEVARLFDPLGWAAPTIVTAKVFIQRLWLVKLDWDEPLPQELTNEWKSYRHDLLEIEKIYLPRWINYEGKNCKVELHGFSDASISAYAAVVYLCVTSLEGKRSSSILSAKTKVAPVKTVSLPRLELCGAALLAKLMRYVLDALRIPLTQMKVYAWTDSEIVLAWLKAHPVQWKTFVANRVSQIHDLMGDCVWSHVPSKENPADHATRGLSPSQLQNCEQWWNGPSWLVGPQEFWPKQKETSRTTLEIRTQTTQCMHISLDKMEERYSSMTRLLRVTAYCYRFKSKQQGYLKASELKTAINIWVKKLQKEHFSEDIKRLKNSMQIPKNSKLMKLSPFLDAEGLLRVGGRLKNAELNFNEKHPVIIPEKSHFTTLLVDKVHKETLHGGSQLMRCLLAKQFWIINARNVIRYRIHKCLVCFRQKAEVQKQLMGNLPPPRVTPSRPFSHVGIDYCGPFDTLRYRGKGARTYKSYVAIFICMAVKAIHIELVTDLSAQGFVAAFRRFTSRRGLPNNVYCDCGSNFMGGNAILNRERQQFMNELNADIASIIENEGVTFHFIPPASPHFGGLWESGVRSTKYHMKRILGNSRLTYEELTTTLNQIEAVLNSRPLCEINNHPDDFTPLTPAHFLIGDTLLTPPEPSLLDLSLGRLDRWQYSQRLFQNFWKRWNSEYLCRLQQRPKWTQEQKNVQINDMVILKEDNLPPSRWLLGRIIKIHPGADGLVRVVTIKTKNSNLKRPIAKICLLPIQNNTR